MLCDDNWRIRWSKKEKTLKDCKIKKFYKNGLFALGEILIIDKLDREDII